MGEYFDNKDPAKDIDPLIKMCEEISEQLENNYIQIIYDEDTMPLFDFDINLNENE